MQAVKNDRNLYINMVEDILGNRIKKSEHIWEAKERAVQVAAFYSDA